jgi:acetyltransferase-like isoleucine patch superfamily enzyme
MNKLVKNIYYRSGNNKLFNSFIKISCYLYSIPSILKIRKSRFKNNKIVISKNLLNKVKFRIKGENNLVRIEPGCILNNCEIRIIGNNHLLYIGENCTILSTIFWFEDEDCTIALGKHNRINGAHIAITEPKSQINIGNDCLFSSYIDIRNGDSHSIIDLNSNKRINYAKNITIGNHVWLSKYVKILKGTNIGDNSVIGINSLVTGNIPAFSLAAGSPIKVLKENITWQIDRINDNR